MRIPALVLASIIIFSLTVTQFIHAETLQVSAVVPASSSNFSTDISSSVNSDSSLSKDKTITFTLGYGSNLSYPSQLIVKASWSRAAENGAEIVTYIPGTASKAYNNTSPVIDTTKRTITWNIPSFPANSASQSVTFDLKTSSSLETSFPLTLNVESRTQGAGDDAYVTKNLTFTYENTISSSNPNSSTSQVTPTITPTPTPSKTLTRPTLFSFNVTSISDTNAGIELTTSPFTSGRLLFGTSDRSLSKGINLSNNTTNQIINLDSLEANTKYFAQIILTNSAGTTTSELYTFTTAEKEEIVDVDLSSLSVVSGNLILNDSPSQKEEKIQRIFLPTHSPYNIQIFIEKSDVIETIDIVVRRHNIQGLTTIIRPASAAELVQMIEINKGTFRGSLLSPDTPSLYDIYLRGYTLSGAISEVKVAELMVYPPFRVVKASDKTPLAEAKAELFYKDIRSGKFTSLFSQKIGVKNPDFSDVHGIIPFVLPKGTYKAKVSRIGYKTKEVTFTIGSGKNDGYPQVPLEKTLVTPSQVVNYLSDSSGKVLAEFMSKYLPSLGTSRMAYHLTAALILVLFFTILLIALSQRLSKHILHLPSFLAYLLTRHKGDNHEYSGTLQDSESDRPLSHASVYLKDENGVILNHAITNKHGEFIFPALPHSAIMVEVVKVGYHPATFHLRENAHRTYLLSKKTPTGLIRTSRHLLIIFLSSSFELLLLLSFLLTILIGMSVGWRDVLPFMGISFLSLTIWTLHYRLEI